MPLNTVTRADILADLKTLGLPPGAKVFVHSSLSSLGHVEGGTDAVIDTVRLGGHAGNRPGPHPDR